MRRRRGLRAFRRFLRLERRHVLPYSAAGASEVHSVEFDADDTASHPALLEKIAAEHGPIGVTVVAFHGGSRDGVREGAR